MTLVTLKRKEAGLTMSEVARRANMLLTKLWKIEHGERRLTAEDIPVLARAIGCAPSDLIPSLDDSPAEETADVS